MENECFDGGDDGAGRYGWNLDAAAQECSRRDRACSCKKAEVSSELGDFSECG